MKTNLITLCLLMTGCSLETSDLVVEPTHRIEYREPKIEEEFIRHVEHFEKLFNVDVNIMIEWTDLTDGHVGVCRSWDDGHREIQIDRQFWPSFTDSGQEQLLFHELGHCIFNLPHNEKLINIGGHTSVPESIMHPVVFGNDYFYEDLKDYYYNQLGDTARLARRRYP